MAHFWANHFAVSAQKQTTLGFAGLLEMEAVRPHVTGPVRRHAAGRRAASGDAVLPRPGAIDRAEQPAWHAGGGAGQQSRAQRESGARDTGIAHARRAHRLRAGRRHRIRPRADRLDGGRGRPRTRRALHARGAGRLHLCRGHPRAGRADDPGAHVRRWRRGARARRCSRCCAVHPATARHIATKLARHFAADDAAAGDGRADRARRSSRAVATCRRSIAR